MDMVLQFLKSKKEVDKASHPELDQWIASFTRHRSAAACEF